MRVLVVKMSSLGDVVHCLPGLTDARQAMGSQITFDWVVEEAFAAIAARHPAVAEVLPIAWRRWRRDLSGSLGELRAFIRALRARRYDLVLDAQGLAKSAMVTALARGADKAGLSRRSAREGVASLFYRRRIEVPRQAHAVDRIRLLFASALGYQLPPGPPDYGIARKERLSGERRCLLLHGTTWASKHWPERFWCGLAQRATAAGYDVRLPWGDAAEQARAERIAAAAPATVLPRQPLGALLDELAAAALVIGVDSGLSHLAAALDVPTLVLYGSTSSALTGCRGSRVRNLQADFPCSPCLERTCRYRGPVPHQDGEAVMPACYAMLPPDAVWSAAREIGDADRLLHF